MDTIVFWQSKVVPKLQLLRDYKLNPPPLKLRLCFGRGGRGPCLAKARWRPDSSWLDPARCKCFIRPSSCEFLCQRKDSDTPLSPFNGTKRLMYIFQAHGYDVQRMGYSRDLLGQVCRICSFCFVGEAQTDEHGGLVTFRANQPTLTRPPTKDALFVRVALRRQAGMTRRRLSLFYGPVPLPVTPARLTLGDD